MKSYPYIGPLQLIPGQDACPPRWQILSVQDVEKWLKADRHEKLGDDTIPVTFIVDSERRLWIADRRSEHVACARGVPVLMAGEIFFGYSSHGVWIERLSNQSTGYCPDPDYRVMDACLAEIAISHPGLFEPACEFRRCPECAQINLVKDDDFTCAVCGEGLPVET